MKRLTILLLIACVPVFAKDKFKESSYKPATLVSFHTEHNGTSCSGNVEATTSDSGQISGTTSSDCSARRIRIYTIQLDGQTIVVMPTHTGKQKAAGMASLGWAGAFEKGSVLRNQLPGAHIEVRSDASGLFIRVGKKESKFLIVEAH